MSPEPFVSCAQAPPANIKDAMGSRDENGLVPVRRLSRLSRSMHFGDVSETNSRETPSLLHSRHVTRNALYWPSGIMRPRD